MIPPTPSQVIPPTTTAQSLLDSGKPFTEFPRFSILDLQKARGPDGSLVPFSEWLTKRLQIGQPVVIQDFEKLRAWDKELFDIERLIDLSTKKNIPIRNCSTGRDLSFTLRKFADAARHSYPEFQNLYARDLGCPEEWQEHCRKLLPTEVQWGGRLDLFQWLPSCARSEVMMAYVGSEGSSSGFHRCFSSTVALNLLVEASDGPVICIGTNFASQQKYDSMMANRGVSPHVDWMNLGPDELKKADFPLYVHEQKVGDLVVNPPATAHQVWNMGTVTTKLVWNILHPLSLEVGFNYVQPPFNRLCHPDVARTNLSLACAMLSLLRGELPGLLPPDLPLLTRLFQEMVRDESIDEQVAAPMQLVRMADTVIATCNFCGTAIWNRHVRCNDCNDFDLCLSCFLSGRSCEHTSSYSWAEIVPPEMCERVLSRAREILGYQTENSKITERRKSLGTAVNELIRAKRTSVTRLCHLCRIDHPEWKGRRCDKCTAFFCFRGLYRHFDVNSTDVIRHASLWTCPKCLETCNCRCCHFPSAYAKAEKPASKRRVKPADTRGKVMGFTDNVFDQKRGQRTGSGHDLPSPTHLTSQKGHKRQLSLTELTNPVDAPVSHRRLDLPTPETESTVSKKCASHAWGYGLIPRLQVDQKQSSSSSSTTSGIPSGLDLQTYSSLPSGDALHTRPGEGIQALATAAASSGKMSHPQINTLLTPVTPSAPRSAHSTPSGKMAQFFGTSAEPPTPKSAINDMNEEKAAAIDEGISQLEDQIGRLRRYGDELLELSLHDSHRMLSEQLSALEASLKVKKKEKSTLLINKLARDFPGLADATRREVEKLGYI